MNTKKCPKCKFYQATIMWKDTRVCVMCYKEELKTQQVVEQLKGERFINQKE